MTRSPYSDLPSEAFEARARVSKILNLADALCGSGYTSGLDVIKASKDPVKRAAAETYAHIRPASDVTWGAS